VKEFQKVTRDDVVAYHRAHFTPRNSLLMVVGRVNELEFRQKVVGAFGGWQGDAPKRDWKNFVDKRLFPSGRRPKNHIYLIHRPNVNQAQVRIGFRAPLINAPQHYALVVGNALLGEYFNSRLNSLIRDKLALTYAINSSFAYSRDFAYFSISSATKSESVGQLIRKTLDVLKDLKRGPITHEEIRMAKDYLMGGFPLATSTLGAVATRWVNGYLFGLGPDYLNSFIPKVSAVARDEVSSAIAKDFLLDDLVIVVVGDSKEIEKSLRAAKLSPVRRVSAADLL
jgi:predicted Zn-dependent peptidase